MTSRALPGTRLGHYEILSLLGSGGMGEVYLAQDTRLNRKVAIKFLQPEADSHERANKRFLREARAAAMLDHSNICSVYEVNEEAGRSYIVMQYVEGETLKARLRQKPCDLTESLVIACQTADALAEAHARGTIHRDIKPSNIMITTRGSVKVMDFGLAKIIHEAGDVRSDAETDALISTPGAIIGTLPYMSPEQVRGEDLDGRSDIFSFGVVLYEMVSGQQPFTSTSSAATASAILTHQVPPLARYARNVPAELERIVTKSLRKAADERYQTASDLLVDLRSLRDEQQFAARLERSRPSNEVNARSAETSGVQTEAGTVVNLLAPTADADRPSRREAATTSDLTGARQTRSTRMVMVTLAALIVAASTIWLLWHRGDLKLASSQVPQIEHQSQTIAVLPFKPMNKAAQDEFLELGMADALITRLSNLRQIVVRPTSAVRKYAGQDQDPVAAGRELKVASVLEGSVQQLDDRIRVTVQLISVEDGNPLWAEKFDEKFANIFSVQDAISEKIAERLALKLTGEDMQRLTKRYTQNTEAYQLYVKGAFYRDKLNEDGLKKAVQYFEEATKADPNYAQAYAGLSSALGPLMFFGFIPFSEGRPRMLAAETKALELDDTLAEAQNESGVFKMYYEYDWSGGENAFKRAIELNPNFALAHHMYANLLTSTGRFDEAISERKKALEIDPLSLRTSALLGWDYYIAGRYDEAIAQYQKTSELDPNFPLISLGEVYEHKGMNDEAIAEYLKEEARSGRPTPDIDALKAAYTASGMKGYWQKQLELLKEKEKQRPVRPLELAELYAKVGEKEQAFECLEKAFQERDPQLNALKINPTFESLHSDSRFQNLLRQVGLTN